MKYISPGPVCISVENTIRSRVGDTVQVERSFLEIDVDMMGGAFQTACFPYKNIALPSQKR